MFSYFGCARTVLTVHVGVVHKPRRPSAAKTAEIQAKRDAALKKRKDARLKNVIINAKTDKKLAKYQIAAAPRGMTATVCLSILFMPCLSPTVFLRFTCSFAFKVFEKTIATPIGPEWNTLQSVAEMTKPKVQHKRGKNIEPIEEKIVSGSKKDKEGKDKSEGEVGKRKQRSRSNSKNKNNNAEETKMKKSTPQKK